MHDRSPLLDWPGAVEAPGVDAGVPWHYGDPLAEQRAAMAFVDRSHRGVVRVDGPDRLSWLHTLTSQHLSDLSANQATEALLLDPQGHVEHHLHVVDDGQSTWIHVEGTRASALLTFLTRMVFWSQVTITDVSDELAVLSLLGGVPDEIPEVLARWSGRAVDVVVPRSELGRVAGGLRDGGLRPAGSWAWEALRIAAVEPRIGIDTDDRTIPNELAWLETAVHLDKGCYRGQETVARVHNLGRPPRRLVLLQLDGSDSTLPEHGAEIQWDGRTVGTLGSAALHWEQGPIALALIRRQVPDDATLDAAGVPAMIDPLTQEVPPEHRQRPKLQRF